MGRENHMREILYSEDGWDYGVTDVFDPAMLRPIIENLKYKQEHEWDDYDEVKHAGSLILSVLTHGGMQMDFHFMIKDDTYSGIALCTTGQLDETLFFGSKLPVIKEEEGEYLFFNYFHIAPDSRGHGEMWLRDVIMPYYGMVGYKAMYLKTSHPRSWSLYSRLGRTVGTYTTYSDNKLYKRKGRIYRLPIVQ